ncbi:hypothetical protein [Methyloraptor flagellatus]|uniref:Uncharacterized protein n=1 Tax=Methyloraptor flagellatus TaxID=3162530 RepID=A0AAU7XBE5_9HYPH
MEPGYEFNPFTRPDTFPDSLAARVAGDEPEGFYKAINSAIAFFPNDRQAQLAFIGRCFDALDRVGAVPCQPAPPDYDEFWVEEPRYGRDRSEIRRAIVAEWLANGAGPMEIWTGVFFGVPDHVTPLASARRYVPKDV